MKNSGTEIARRPVSHISAIPALPGIGAILEKYMWVHTISHTPLTDLRTGRTRQMLHIQGIIKPDLEAPDSPSLRHGFLESFEAIVAVLNEAGARWGQHPALLITGKVRADEDGVQRFCEAEASINLDLLA